MKDHPITEDLAAFLGERDGGSMTEEQMLRLLATAIRDAQESVLITDTELDEPGPRIVFVNPAFTRMTGYEPHEALGKSPRMLQGPKTDRAMLNQLRKSLAQTGRFSATAVNYRKDGEEYVVEWDIAPVVDDDGVITHYVSIQRDVTERKRDEERLRQTARDLKHAIDEAAEARSAAEIANEAKSRFVANLSHEIRTPMTSIIGFAKVLQEEAGFSEDTRDKIEQIIRSSDHLLTLINDILDLSRVEAGRLPIEPEPFDFERLLDDTISLHKPSAEKAGLRLELIITNSLPPRVMLDRHRTQQILTNLLSNAIKFTTEGGVRVRVAHDSSGGRIQIEVEDDGPGIPSDQRERIFEPFHQVGLSETERTRGTGLGLAITRHLARAMNGDIAIESEPGVGSTFTVDLPAIYLQRGRTAGRAKPSGTTDSGGPVTLDGLTVLAVDDHEANRMLLQHVLKRSGATVVLAEDGEQAIERFDQQPPDIIVLDVLMPGIDGYETARRIRRKPGGERVPILMLTAYAMSGDRDKSLEAGANSYLSKPFNPSELVATVSHLVRSQDRPAPKVSHPPAIERPGGDRDDEFVALSLEFIDHHIERLSGYLSTSPSAEVMKVWAHQLAGAGGSFGYPELTEQARALEHAVDQGSEPPTLGDGMRALLASLHRRRTELKEG